MGTLRFFDFSAEVERAIAEARDEISRWCARTEVGRRLFPGAVERAGFCFLRPHEEARLTSEEHLVVIGVATWSDRDLAALDRLAQETRKRHLRVVVFDVDDWQLEEIRAAFPGTLNPKATPVVLRYERGTLTYAGDGHDAVLWLDQI
jgi:hypothetical protein